MKRLSLLVLLVWAAVVAEGALFGGGKNEQNGSFFLYKVKPRCAKDVEILLRSEATYEQHVPIFLQDLQIGQNAQVLIEDSKEDVFKGILTTNGIKFQSKGKTLVDKISTSFPQPASASSSPSPSANCDCNYQSGGCIISKAPPSRFACKCSKKGYWRCSGSAVTCPANKQCPGNCTTLECCKTGGGDCEGYEEQQED